MKTTTTTPDQPINKHLHVSQWLANLKPFQQLIFICLFQMILWTVVSVWIHGSAPLDVMEALAWGRQWQFGYDRDPYLVAWVAYSLSHLFGDAIWPTFLASQICIALTFYAIWRLARTISFTPAQALLSVLLLEGISYYHFTSPEFNDNVLQLPTWAFTTYFFYLAVTTQRLKSWVSVGIAAGLAMMAKYFSIMLFLPMLGILLGTRHGRRSFRYPGCYIALIIALIIMAPNIWWQFQHHFQYISYAVSRTVAKHAWYNFAWFPLRFLLGQIIVLSVFFVMAYWFCFRFNVKKNTTSTLTISNFAKHYIWIIALAPMLLTICYAAFSQSELHTMWGTPLFNCAGLLAVMLTTPKIPQHERLRIVVTSVLIICASVSLFIASIVLPPYLFGYAKEPEFPGTEMATKLTQIWHENYHSPMPYVAGPRRMIVKVTTYSSDHPIPFIDWQSKSSFWMDVNDMKQRGAVFIWNADKLGNELPFGLEKTYPQAKLLSPIAVNWQTKAHLAPAHIGVALLPPVIIK